MSRVAVAAALTVPSVIRQVGGMSRLTGRDLPRADVSMGDRSVSVNLYIAVVWPSRVSEVARAVHDEVDRVLDGIVGLPLHRLNVLVVGTAPGKGSDDGRPTSSAGETTRTPLSPRPPTASPAAVPIALGLALTLLAAAFVAGREFLIVNGTFGGAPWIGNAVAWIADLHWAVWMIPAAVASILVGLTLVALGVKPRTRTHTGAFSPTSPSPTVWLRPTDVARMCSDHANGVPGVESARTTVTRRKVTVDVRRLAGSDSALVTEAVRTAVAPALAVLADSRKVRVRVKDGT